MVTLLRNEPIVVFCSNVLFFYLFPEKNVFGVPLLTIAHRTGNPLPQAILLALNYLSRNALNCEAIFRKSGVKSRIEKLKEEIENGTNKSDYESYAVYDIADMVKQYFRELPEPLLTSKLAETFISIYRGKKRFSK